MRGVSQLAECLLASQGGFCSIVVVVVVVVVVIGYFIAIRRNRAIHTLRMQKTCHFGVLSVFLHQSRNTAGVIHTSLSFAFVSDLWR